VVVGGGAVRQQARDGYMLHLFGLCSSRLYISCGGGQRTSFCGLVHPAVIALPNPKDRPPTLALQNTSRATPGPEAKQSRTHTLNHFSANFMGCDAEQTNRRLSNNSAESGALIFRAQQLNARRECAHGNTCSCTTP
jgi:hypothetical protein